VGYVYLYIIKFVQVTKNLFNGWTRLNINGYSLQNVRMLDIEFGEGELSLTLQHVNFYSRMKQKPAFDRSHTITITTISDIISVLL
jgi:hypothetical protein